MAKLTAAARKALPKATFGVPAKAPGSGSYPMPNKQHAGLAKSYATKEVAKGNLSAATEKKIDAKANAVLGKGKKKK